ncbi:MAG: STAS domain-containing protein [Chloroflexota bacterium]
MNKDRSSKIPAILEKFEDQILDDWVKEQLSSTTMRKDLISSTDVRRESTEFLLLLRKAASTGNLQNFSTPEWGPVKDFLAGISRSRALLGFPPSDTAIFIFSLKQPLFKQLQAAYPSDTEGLADEFWIGTTLLDKLGLITFETYQNSREDIIKQQQIEMLELSTPVVSLWQGIIALPLIGTLDSSRTQVVMENLLETIVKTGSEIAIIDITGVPTVDTLVAQHLLKTVAAARLMGAQCVISGIRPQIAQTMVHLGVVFGDVVTKASLSDALSYAFKHLGVTVSRKVS